MKEAAAPDGVEPGSDGSAAADFDGAAPRAASDNGDPSEAGHANSRPAVDGVLSDGVFAPWDADGESQGKSCVGTGRRLSSGNCGATSGVDCDAGVELHGS